MNFQQKCEVWATNDHVDVNDPHDASCPDSVKTKLESLVKIMQPKMGILDKINIPFIEKEMDRSPDELYTALNTSCQGCIPDGIINVLSQKLYEKQFNDMSTSEQAIIKVLSVYLMIQI